MKHFAIATLVIAGGLLAGCGGGSTDAADVSAAPPAATSPAAEPATPTPEPTTAEAEESEEPFSYPTSFTTLTDRQWKKIVRDPDAFAGKGVILYANVFQFDAATGNDTFLAYASYQDDRSYGYWDGDDTAVFVGTKKQLRNVVEDDVVRVKAVVDSSFSYDTQIGGNTTVPLLYVDKIEVIGSTE